jgi:signal transduction histidine kinase
MKRARVEGAAWKEEREELSRLADLAELSRPVAHEFNNFLNALLLHLAALESELPKRLRSDLVELRAQGIKIGGMVKQFQQYRNREEAPSRPTDLNQAVNQVVEMLGPRLPELTLSLAPELPLVSATYVALKQLCTWLLSNAAAALPPCGGHIWVKTLSANEYVQLRVEDTGSAIAAELLADVFNPLTTSREGTNPLELGACQALARRLHGKIECANRAEGGVAMILSLLASR